MPSTLSLSMHPDALPSFQRRERLCLGGVGEPVLSRKYRGAYQSLCLAGGTDTLPSYPVTVQAFFPVRPGSRTLYNIDAVLSYSNNACP